MRVVQYARLRCVFTAQVFDGECRVEGSRADRVQRDLVSPGGIFRTIVINNINNINNSIIIIAVLLTIFLVCSIVERVAHVPDDDGTTVRAGDLLRVMLAGTETDEPNNVFAGEPLRLV